MLRPATPADAGFLYELYADARRDEFAALGWPAAQLDALLRGQYLAQVTHYATRFPGAEHSIVLVNDQPAGRWYVDRSAAAIRLVDVCLLRTCRGRGIGTALIATLQAEAAAQRRPVELSVVDGNPAYRLYRRLGFVERALDGVHRQLEWWPPSPADAPAR